MYIKGLIPTILYVLKNPYGAPMFSTVVDQQVRVTSPNYPSLNSTGPVIGFFVEFVTHFGLYCVYWYQFTFIHDMHCLILY